MEWTDLQLMPTCKVRLRNCTSNDAFLDWLWCSFADCLDVFRHFIVFFSSGLKLQLLLDGKSVRSCNLAKTPHIANTHMERFKHVIEPWAHEEDFLANSANSKCRWTDIYILCNFNLDMSHDCLVLFHCALLAPFLREIVDTRCDALWLRLPKSHTQCTYVYGNTEISHLWVLLPHTTCYLNK